MKKTGASLARYALEQLPISYTFGIPGVHNTELYDELNRSEKITPILVTHEGCGAFMGDALSRVSDEIGCLLIVPAAGVTHAASGIGEAFLDGIPLLVIAGGIRADSDYGYQLHEIDQHKMLQAITKKTFKVESQDKIVETIFEAYNIATTGEPGPVFVELPVNIQLDRGNIEKLPNFEPIPVEVDVADETINQALTLLAEAKNPGIFVGWGGVHASKELITIAEHLDIPVATTLQGVSSFPANHPLHCGFGIGPAAVPAARNAFAECDCLLAIGTRFGEIATGSYGIQVPENLLHLDINDKVFNRNYPAKVILKGDAQVLLSQMAEKLVALFPGKDNPELKEQIKSDKKAHRQQWYLTDNNDRVNPARFYDALRAHLDDDGYVVMDDGNHTFLTAELMPIHHPRGLISPTDFNCMGYAVPATLGVKFAHPDKQVVSVVGDGAFLMTAMELATAKKNELGVIQCIFNDGELSQIAQAQQRPYNNNTCSELASIQFEGIAQATGCGYIKINNNQDLDSAMEKAFKFAAQKKPVLVDVNIDYTKPTCFTDGVVKTNIKRLPFDTKVRMVGRALYRKLKN